jgi:hypothetical protein
MTHFKWKHLRKSIMTKMMMMMMMMMKKASVTDRINKTALKKLSNFSHEKADQSSAYQQQKREAYMLC